MTLAYLSAGSNMGDRVRNLAAGICDLGQRGISVRKVSSIYETEPVGIRDQPWFLNLALEVKTEGNARELLLACLDIEAARGRIRSYPGAPRVLDLDILLFGDLILDEPEIRIPHPRMALRRFVLEPLAEIAPHRLHPGLGKSIRDLLAECPDDSRIVRSSCTLPFSRNALNEIEFGL
jgi:2-amino-4-hydroxy-6-hydroxymethyldihydropteridine diphosphokinase